MLQRDVIGVIPVNRRVLLIAEVPVCAGSGLDGTSIADVNGLDGVRVIAVAAAGRSTWTPPPGHRLSTGAVLTVVASRDGLSRVVAASTA